MDGSPPPAQPTFWRMKNRDLVWDFREAARVLRVLDVRTGWNENIYTCEHRRRLFIDLSKDFLRVAPP